MKRFGSTSAPRVTTEIQTISCPAAILQETSGLSHVPAWSIVSDQEPSFAGFAVRVLPGARKTLPVGVSPFPAGTEQLLAAPDIGSGLPAEEEEEQEPRLPSATPSTAAPTRESGSDSADLLHQSHHRYFNPKYSSTERKGKHTPIMPVSFTCLA